MWSFAPNITLEEVRNVIRRANERLSTLSVTEGGEVEVTDEAPAVAKLAKIFLEKDRGEYVIFNYAMIGGEKFFPTPNTGDPELDREFAVLRECRGLTFSKDDGRMLNRKFHKFFNINERSETKLENIDFTRHHHVLSKLDGSMITAMLLTGDRLVWASKQGESEVSDQPTVWVADGREHYTSFARELLSGDDPKTPLFEWCSRANRIVLDYPEDRLVLTAIRYNISGAYMRYEEMVELATSRGIDVVQALSEPVKAMERDLFMDKVKALPDEEGYVVRFADGHMYKVKAEMYLKQHRAIDGMSKEKAVLELILAEGVDDILPALRASDREALANFRDAVTLAMQNTAAKVESLIAIAKVEFGDDNRRFAVEFVKTSRCACVDDSLLFNVWKGKDTLESIKNIVLFKIDKSQALRNSVLAGHRWEDFRNAPASERVRATNGGEVEEIVEE